MRVRHGTVLNKVGTSHFYVKGVEYQPNAMLHFFSRVSARNETEWADEHRPEPTLDEEHLSNKIVGGELYPSLSPS